MSDKEQKLCKDIGRPGCNKYADPEYTVYAADYGVDDDDLYFCKPCRKEGDKLVAEIEEMLDSGDLTVEEFAQAIAEESPN